MLARKICVVFALTLFLGAGQVILGAAAQPQPEKKSELAVTEILQVMGKGADYIVIGEESLYVEPKVTKITNAYGRAISLERLRTPCLAEVTYSRWMRGVERLPVVLHLKVKKTPWAASSEDSQE